jgi:transposase
MHLGSSTRRKNGVFYKYYSIVESFRNEEGKSRKRTIKPLGKLTPSEVKEWKFRLSLINGDIKESDIMLIDQMEYVEAKKYLDVALLSNIYDQLGIGNIFNNKKNPSKTITSKEVAKILTISRCLDPVAKYKTVQIFSNSYLPELMDIPVKEYNKNKIFRELSAIHDKREDLQDHFFKIAKKISANEEVELYFFDGTTSFFEGHSCDLATGGMDKTHGYQDKTVLICLLTNKAGYPIAWDVYSGSRRDVSEFKTIANELAASSKIKDVTFCFDRGIASATNFELIEKTLESKFITGLKKDQLNNIFNIENFVDTTRSKLIKALDKQVATGIPKTIKPVNGFYKLGKNRFYKDLGVKDGRRYVVSFNVNIFEQEQLTRNNNIKKAEDALSSLNYELQAAKASRDDEVVEGRVKDIIGKYKFKSVINYQIVPAAIDDKIQTYKVHFDIDQDALDQLGRNDGILVYITNHVEGGERGQFKVSASTIVQHYKDKYVIEDCFKHLKSFLDLRPFYVRKTSHIKAHVDICMCSYFINHYIRIKLRDLGISILDFYDLIKEHSRVCKIKSDNKDVTLLRKLPKEINTILTALNSKKIIQKGGLKEIGITKK